MCRAKLDSLTSEEACPQGLEDLQMHAESLAKSLRSQTCQDTFRNLGDPDAAEHMTRYTAWAAQAQPKEASKRASKARMGAASGVALAADVLAKSLARMGTMRTRFRQLHVTLQDLEETRELASAFNGERPVAADIAVEASDALAQAAERCRLALEMLPASTAWVELPDPGSIADALEAAAIALEKGRSQLAELEAFQVVAVNRIEAREKNIASAKRDNSDNFDSLTSVSLLGPFGLKALTEGLGNPDPGMGRSETSEECGRSWSDVRGLLKVFGTGSRSIDTEAATTVLSEVFHVFDDLIDGLARILEELICLESETESMCPALLGAAQVQSDLLEWKLTLLDNETNQVSVLSAQQSCQLTDFVEVVLAVGDAMLAATAQMRRRRRKVVEGLKASIEIKAAMMPSLGKSGPSQLFAD
ncbi:rpa1 [Symbiodinium natans]|uniref:Rpa1 protein n=1 Tax=Symbiodinium natans TaxID=878477 RepID=A0A812UFP6_9DINO|nr:rpa1 [Symbiodinium natans]